MATRTCDCGATTDKPRLPRGWKDKGGRVVCADCLKSKYHLLAPTLCVDRCEGLSWREFTQQVCGMLETSTALANWFARKLLALDPLPTPCADDPKQMPPQPSEKIYLYPEARRAFPDMQPACIPAMEQAIKNTYKERRFAVWHGDRSPTLFRYPYPFPFPEPAWDIGITEGGEPFVSLPIRGVRRRLILRGGSEVHRQLKQFKQLLSGEALPGWAELYTDFVSKSGHRPMLTTKQPGGGNTRYHRIKIKLVGYFPRSAREPGERILLLRTDPNALWVAEMKDTGGKPWILNMDHVRRAVLRHAAHGIYLQRISEDTKREKRWPARERIAINEARERKCIKHENRMKTWIEEMCAVLTGYAVRQKVGQVWYDEQASCMATTDANGNRYEVDFPWQRLQLALKARLDKENITLVAKGVVMKQEEEEELPEV